MLIIDQRRLLIRLACLKDFRRAQRLNREWFERQHARGDEPAALRRMFGLPENPVLRLDALKVRELAVLIVPPHERACVPRHFPRSGAVLQHRVIVRHLFGRAGAAREPQQREHSRLHGSTVARGERFSGILVLCRGHLVDVRSSARSSPARLRAVEMARHPARPLHHRRSPRR